MLVINRFQSGNESCVYLPEQTSLLEYEVAIGIRPEEYEDRMNSGWRKFGNTLFRPICLACNACRPIRILADRFQLDRSQVRALRANADLEVSFEPPICDMQRIALFNKYHQHQETRKGWFANATDQMDYYFQFVENTLPAIEISVWEEGRLCAVALTEQTPNTLSGVYHFYDPDLRDRSLGTFVMLQTILLAKNLQKPYAYFGFYVAGCSSLNYKARFRPCELLGADGLWYPYEPEKESKR